MNPYEDFIRKSEHIIQDKFRPGQYYVVCADITDFFSVNHYYGNEAGDAVLQEMEGLFSSKRVLLCSRIFADLILCLYYLENDIKMEDKLKSFDDDFQTFLVKQWSVYPACRIKAACGVCRIENDNLLQSVDKANIARKISKKQLNVKTILYTREMEERSVAFHKCEQEIYSAIKEDRFCFYLQPQINLQTGEIIGAEALIRRVDQGGMTIEPDQFIELAEANGTVIELDEIICRKVCAFLADRIKKELPVFCIAVNLSRLHIQNPEAAGTFHAISVEYGIPAELLGFELTESILLEEFSGAKRLIGQLRSYGHRVSIDDFGSGYTGINIWQELDFDCLKLDKKFLSDDQSAKQRNEAIVPNIINIAQRLHVEVLCEGVETEAQCRYLLQLGCTLVQGFFFSCPLPPEQMFRIYERQSRKYPLPESLIKPERRGAPDKNLVNHGHLKAHAKFYILVILLCALFLGACIAGVLTINRNQTHQEFTSMVTETLNAYTNGQRENTLKEIDGVTSTLQSLAVLIKKSSDPNFIDAYLLALNEESREVDYMYTTDKESLNLLVQGTVQEHDIDMVERMRQGENVVTSIIRSERESNNYCIGIGVPVISDGEFIGAVLGIVDADALVSTELYDPAQGIIEAVFLTDGNSKILPLRGEEESAVGERLLDRLEEFGIDEVSLYELEAAFSLPDSKAQSVRIGTFDDSPYYISTTGLKYNDWHLVVCLKADQALVHFNYIIHKTNRSITGLLLAVLFTCLILIYFIRKMQQKFSLDEQRYLLLERFSDTVLFDYDCRHDTIRFSPNVTRLLRVHQLVQKDFLYHLDQVYVYAADQNEVYQMLSGKYEDVTGEIRVRLMRPLKDEYFWCLVQYQYFYEKRTLASIIAKITDVDESMRHENYLLKMSETDGLTGLLNKAAAEKEVLNRLKQEKRGMLFIMDVDNFKQVNDEYGHDAGDRVLQYIGRCMRLIFHDNDVLGRIGGDELLVFAETIHCMEDAQRSADLLNQCLNAGMKQEIPKFSVSIGIAEFPIDGKNYQELFHTADQSMYAIKKERERGDIVEKQLKLRFLIGA